jgi:hypothetical protein
MRAPSGARAWLSPKPHQLFSKVVGFRCAGYRGLVARSPFVGLVFLAADTIVGVCAAAIEKPMFKTCQATFGGDIMSQAILFLVKSKQQIFSVSPWDMSFGTYVPAGINRN